MNGDSLAIDQSIYSIPVLNRAFQIFANSKTGRAYLAKYAKEGQSLYEYTFSKSGIYHTEGINMAYSASDSKGDESGKTDKELTQNGATITVKMNINKAKDESDENIYETVDTYAHESFIHCYLFT